MSVSRDGKRRAAASSLKRLQARFDLRAARLEEWRQREFFAERFHRLLGGKAGSVRGALAQDALRLAEKKAAKKETVHLAPVWKSAVIQPPPPRLGIFLALRARRPL